MNNLKRSLSLGFASALLMSVVATTFGMQKEAPVKQVSIKETTARTSASTAHTTHQRLGPRRSHQRYAGQRLKVSVRKTKRVPKAKSLSKESY